jgi:hypothetical protein
MPLYGAFLATGGENKSSITIQTDASNGRGRGRGGHGSVSYELHRLGDEPHRFLAGDENSG